MNELEGSSDENMQNESRVDENLRGACDRHKEAREKNTLNQGSTDPFLKGRKEQVFFAWELNSLQQTQLCHCRMKAAEHNTGIWVSTAVFQ